MSVTYNGTIKKSLYSNAHVGNDGACCFTLGFGTSAIDWGTNPPASNLAAMTLDALLAEVSSSSSQYSYSFQYNITITGTQGHQALAHPITDVAFYDSSDTTSYCNTSCTGVYESCTLCSANKLAVNPMRSYYTVNNGGTYDIDDTFNLDNTAFATTYPYSISIYVHNQCVGVGGCGSSGADNYTFTLTLMIALTNNNPSALWGCINSSCAQGTGSQYTYTSQTACQADTTTACYVNPATSLWGCIGGTCTQGTGSAYTYQSEGSCKADTSTNCYAKPSGISTKTIFIIAGVVIGLIIFIILMILLLKKGKSKS